MGIKSALNGNFKFVVTCFLTLVLVAVPAIGGYYIMRERVLLNKTTIIENHKAEQLNHDFQIRTFREHCVDAEGKMKTVNDNMSNLKTDVAVISTKQDTVMKNQSELKKSVDEIKGMIMKGNTQWAL